MFVSVFVYIGVNLGVFACARFCQEPDANKKKRAMGRVSHMLCKSNRLFLFGVFDCSRLCLLLWLCLICVCVFVLTFLLEIKKRAQNKHA